MPIPAYGVLKGRLVDTRFPTNRSPHYQLHVVDNQDNYRVAINVNSSQTPSDLLYLVDEHFQHPFIQQLDQLPNGYQHLPSQAGGAALDYIRGNLFDPTQMQIISDSGLADLLDKYAQQALGDAQALVYAFGDRWNPDNKPDQYFGFRPDNGIHDIHMNQGNDGSFVRDDGVWQDGGMLINFPSNNQWVAIFLKFQSQAWHTDDTTGHTIDNAPPVSPNPPVTTPEPTPTPVPVPTPTPTPVTVSDAVRIVAALVNLPDATAQPAVTLLNISPDLVDLNGWAIADSGKQKFPISGTIAAGGTAMVRLPSNVQLDPNGGIITLLNADGLKVHGVSYTQSQDTRQGWTIAF